MFTVHSSKPIRFSLAVAVFSCVLSFFSSFSVSLFLCSSGCSLTSWYSCMKVKKSSSKATYAAKNAPPFCEIWFVNKGKLAWTQETSEIAVSTEETLRPRSLPLPYCNTTMSLPQDGLIPSSRTLTSAGITGWDHSKTVRMLSPKLPTLSSSFSAFHFQHDQGVSPRTDTRSGYAFAGRKKSTDSDIQVEYENLYNQLREIKAEAETLRKKAREDHLKRKDLESEALEAINKVMMNLGAHF